MGGWKTADPVLKRRDRKGATLGEMSKKWGRYTAVPILTYPPVREEGAKADRVYAGGGGERGPAFYRASGRRRKTGESRERQCKKKKKQKRPENPDSEVIQKGV